MSGVGILIVDDDVDIRAALSDVLTDEGYTVATAEDGLAALEYLATHEAPALILLDLMMPRVDGAEFRVRQLANPAIARIPVVVLTADARAENRLRDLALAACLFKPVELKRLLEVVRRFV